MNNNKKCGLILITIVVLGIVIFIANMFLASFYWHFRGEILLLAFFMVTLGSILFSLWGVCQIKSIIIKCLLILPWFIICAIFFFISFMIFGLCLNPDIERNIDGVNYIGVEHTTNRLRKDVYYYDKYNFIAYNYENMVIKEFYDEYGVLHTRTYFKNPKTDSLIYYYDENKNIIDVKTYNENGSIVDVENKEKYINNISM